MPQQQPQADFEVVLERLVRLRPERELRFVAVEQLKRLLQKLVGQHRLGGRVAEAYRPQPLFERPLQQGRCYVAVAAREECKHPRVCVVVQDVVQRVAVPDVWRYVVAVPLELRAQDELRDPRLPIVAVDAHRPQELAESVVRLYQPARRVRRPDPLAVAAEQPQPRRPLLK